ncbi:MAG: hypothetical protein AB1401_11615 [Thermodesulfobacteriota bacterium]
MSNIDELFKLVESLVEESTKLNTDGLDKLMTVSEEVGKSWSGSWLGYHSRVYYKDFKPVPPGARFSKEWGMMDRFAIRETRGEWQEYDFDSVINVIYEQAGNIDPTVYNSQVKEATEVFEESKASILSILAGEVQDRQNDSFLNDLFAKIKNKKVFGASDFVKYFAP